MNKKIVIGLTSATLAFGAIASIGMAHHASLETKAATEATVYCAINPATLGNYTLKLNTNQQTNPDSWYQYDMVDTGNTFLGLKLYSYTFTDLWNGVDKMQFQLYDGSTYKEQHEAISSWKSPAEYNGKTYLYDKYRWYDAEPTVTFVKNGSVGDALTYNVGNDQFEGIITTLSDGDTIKVRETIGGESSDYYDLEDGVTAATEDNENKCVTITNAGTYVVYFKEYSQQMWITEADAALVAYTYAGYFLTNIKCDASGLGIPAGWDDCETRYGKLSDAVKNYIYNFNIAKADQGENNDIVRMIRRYDWAISHNPNGLSHFIVNSSGAERPLSAYNGGTFTISVNQNADNAAWVFAAITSAAGLAAGAMFLLRKKKEQ